MNITSSSHYSASHSMNRPADAASACRALVVFLAMAIASPLAVCQSQSSSQPAPSQPAPQQQPQQKDDASVAAAAKKTDKDKPKPRKVFTEEDLSSLHGGVSVVGDSAGSGAKPAATGSAGTRNAPTSGQDEQYWRGQAKQILDAIATTDQEIAKTKDDIKKYGADGFDATSGFKNNIIYIDNRASKLEQLEKRKSDLEKKLDELQEEGRKAGADPDSFR